MDQDNIEDSLVAAINGNDWNRIYRLASPGHPLKELANWFQDRADSKLLLKSVFTSEDRNQATESGDAFRRWLSAHHQNITNQYMYNLLECLSFFNSPVGTECQVSSLERLASDYPNGWEAYVLLAIAYNNDAVRVKESLEQAKRLAPDRESVYLWSVVLNGDPDVALREGENGYMIGQNNLFLLLIARKLQRRRPKEAKSYYKRVVNNEPENSYIRKLADDELFSMLPRYFLVVRWTLFIVSAVVGALTNGEAGFIVGMIVGWVLQYPAALMLGSLRASLRSVLPVK